MENLIRMIFGIPLALAQAAAEKPAEEPGVLAYVLSKLPLYFTAVVVFLIFLVIAVMVKKSVESQLSAKIEEEHQEVLIISGRLSFLAVILIGATIALSIAGIDLTALLAALAFGISFGLQDTISNFVAGLGILASQPFKLGDFISINGNMGKVVEIRTRATYLKTADGLRLIVPNAELYAGSVLSYTSNPTRRIRVPISCKYGANLEQVSKICIKAAKQHKEVMLEPKPSVIITEMGDYFMGLTLRFWVVTGTPWLRVKSKIQGEIQHMLEEAGIAAPYPVTALTTIEGMETGVLRTQAMNENDVKAWVMEREKTNADYVQKLQEMLEDKPPATVVPDRTDTQGANFIQGANFVQSPNFPIASAVLKEADAKQVQPAPAAFIPSAAAIPTAVPVQQIAQTPASAMPTVPQVAVEQAVQNPAPAQPQQASESPAISAVPPTNAPIN